MSENETHFGSLERFFEDAKNHWYEKGMEEVDKFRREARAAELLAQKAEARANAEARKFQAQRAALVEANALAQKATTESCRREVESLRGRARELEAQLRSCGELLEGTEARAVAERAERDEWRRLHDEKADQLRRALNESSVIRAKLVEIALLVNNEWDSSASVEQLAAEILDGIDRRRKADGEEIGALKERLRRALGALEERGVEAAGPDGEPSGGTPSGVLCVDHYEEIPEGWESFQVERIQASQDEVTDTINVWCRRAR